jgi:hypothetical protein
MARLGVHFPIVLYDDVIKQTIDETIDSISRHRVQIQPVIQVG